MYGINVARFSLNPKYKTEGLRAGNKKLMVFCSEQVGKITVFSVLESVIRKSGKKFEPDFQAHYSTEKACAFMGLGTDSMVRIKSDENGAMCVKDLKQKIDENSTSVR